MNPFYAALPMALALSLFGCREAQVREPKLEKMSPRSAASQLKPLSRDVFRGICLAHTYEDNGAAGYGTETSRRTLREIRGLGANWVSLTPFAFMKHRHATQVMLIDELSKQWSKQNAPRGIRGETDEVMRREIRAARELGLKVQIKPHIWMLDGSWRGKLDPGAASAMGARERSASNEASTRKTPAGEPPAGELPAEETPAKKTPAKKTPAKKTEWSAFWASYRAFLLHYAHMAARHGASMLVIGVELDHTMRFEPQWRSLISDVRRVYDGSLVYAANWDAVDKVPIWDALDYVGVQFYPPLARKKNASEATMNKTLARSLDSLERLSKRTQKPVIFTEVGFRAVADTALRPHEWPDPKNRNVDESAQAQTYRVFFRGIQKRRWAAGVFLWKWFTDPNTNEEGPAGFSPRNKRAQKILERAFYVPR